LTSLKTSLYAVYNGESNANDSFGSRNGTPMGGLTYTTGKIGQAFNFNGSTSYVDMGDVMDVGTSSWSYSMWFNATNAFFTQTVFGKTIAAGVRGRIWAQIDNNKLVMGFDADATNVIIVETPALSVLANTWYHVVFVLDRNDKLKLYLNGSLVSLTTTNGTNNLIPYSATNYNTNNPFRIGAYTASDNTTAIGFYSGKIDEFNIWNRVLTQSEITDLYNSGNGSQYVTDSFYKPTTNDALGTYNGTPMGGLTYTTGKIGQAFQFNGTNSYVSLPNSSGQFNFTGDFSVSMWFRSSNLSTSRYVIGNYKAGGSYGYGWVLYYTGAGGFAFDVRNNNSINQVTKLLPLLTNTWYHVVAVRKMGQIHKLYINGVDQSATQTEGNVNNVAGYTANQPMSLGGLSDINLPALCDLDGVNMWTKTLTQAEITELYNSGAGKQYPF
jgi:hypothetical protein